MSRAVVTVWRASPAAPAWSARCATCHGSLCAEEAVQCPRCATLLHADCRGALQACPTFGCGPRAREKPSSPPAEAPLPAPRLARGGLALAAVGLGLSLLGPVAWLVGGPPRAAPRALTHPAPAPPPPHAPAPPAGRRDDGPARDLFAPLEGPPAPAASLRQPSAAEEAAARDLFAPLR